MKKKWPLLDVTSGAYSEEIEGEALAGLAKHVESYGVEIVRFGNFVIGIDDEDGDHLKSLYRDAAYLKTVGGVGNYKDFAAGKAMMGAGEGMAKGGGGGDGGGLLGGAGLGVGLGMAQMLVKDNNGGETLAPATGGVVCGACNNSVAPGKFCGACGEPLKAAAKTGKFCTSCGEATAPGAKFCGSCGESQA